MILLKALGKKIHEGGDLFPVFIFNPTPYPISLVVTITITPNLSIINVFCFFFFFLIREIVTSVEF